MTDKGQGWVWAVVRRVNAMQEAHRLRFALEQAGIPVDVWDVHLNTLHPWASLALGIRVAVPRDRLEEAERILTRGETVVISDAELTRQALAAPMPVAGRKPPKGRAERFRELTEMLLPVLLLIFGLVFLVGFLRHVLL